MITESNSQVAKKRALTKIRAQFLHKKGDDEEETYVNPDTRRLSGDTICVLVPTMGLIENNRKISLGPQNLNLFFKISDLMIELRPFNRVAKVDFSVGTDITPLPWDYTLRRLASYGDLELARLANILNMFQNIASCAISGLYDSVSKDDPISRKKCDEMKFRVRKLCEEAERNCYFYKALFLITKDAQIMISNLFSERLLEEMGYSPESFLKWAEKNGMPSLFTNDSPVYASAIRTFVGLLFLGEDVYVSPIEEAFLCAAKKTKKKMLVQTVAALEPIANGFLLHSYFVGKMVISKKLEMKKKCLQVDSSENEFIEEKTQGVTTDSDIL